ncbi:MAG TPA: urease accessory protein UreD [Planctomycetota bacterium]|nr:urease accessory protein UreD [Planctomycetota bacterium]
MSTTPHEPPLPHDAGRLLPGVGRLQVELIDGLSSATVIAAHAPMKLLVPSPRGPAVWAFASSFGGGLVAGDHIALEVTVGEGAATAIGTQSSTKVYRDAVDAWAEQSLHAHVGCGASLALLPDPVTPFAGSRYRQRFDIDLAEAASLLLIDSCTSGRAARDERWAFTAYDSRIRLTRGGAPLLIDATRLDAGGSRSVAERMGRFQTLSTVLLVGPRFAHDTARLLAWCAAQPIEPGAPLRIAASPLADGVVLRCAATAYEPIDRWLREHLQAAAASFGDHWSRKP